jgi:hypothetical protein
MVSSCYSATARARVPTGHHDDDDDDDDDGVSSGDAAATYPPEWVVAASDVGDGTASRSRTLGTKHTPWQ